MSTPLQRTWSIRIGLIAVALVPLAFAGLVAGAAGRGSGALDHIPVAVVNQDTLQKTTLADGTEQNVFAGRQLVTELTGADGFDWTITNEADAAAALKAGEVYAIVTIPSDFSTSILSLSTAEPRKADLSIRTDDSHSYLTGSVAQAVGTTLTDTFGRAITAQYLGGVYANIGDLGGALSTAADGAGSLSTGASSLSAGLSQYTGGVDSLSGGLSQLDSGASGLSQLSAGVGSYTSSVSQLSAALSQVNPGIQANPTVDPRLAGALQQVTDGLAQASAGGQQLASRADSGISELQYGISQSASGAQQLAGGGPALNAGATQLASGAQQLATGLQSGAASIPQQDEATAKTAAEVASDPVSLSVSTDNPVTEVGQAIATFFVPLGLWIGALATFLVLRPVTRRALASTARDGRLMTSALVRAGAVTAAQAVLVVGLLHGALGVAWSLLPATLGFSLVTAFAFTAFHYFASVWLGRGGLVLSLLLLAVQLTSTGGVYPVEALSGPFQAISPLLPLTYAVTGMQGIISGGNPGPVVVAALVLAAFGLASILLARVALGRARRAGSLQLLPARG